MTDDFEKEVETGLNSYPRHISSRFFYDREGSELFVKITQTPEYYLTSAEREIFREQAQEIVRAFQLPDEYVELVEFGAGDGHKTMLLLEAIKNKNLCYVPVDISQKALSDLCGSFRHHFPTMVVRALREEYFEALKKLDPQIRKVILFLGSNLGNFSDQQARHFLKELGQLLHPGDSVLLGLDLIKPAAVVLPAYDDASGVTRAFNLNLLARINRELGGQFDLSGWEHRPEYDALEGVARSSLEALHDQTVYIRALDQSFHFAAGDRIHTEISRKYSTEILQDILRGTGFTLEQTFRDRRHYFADYLLRRNPAVV